LASQQTVRKICSSNSRLWLNVMFRNCSVSGKISELNSMYVDYIFAIVTTTSTFNQTQQRVLWYRLDFHHYHIFLLLTDTSFIPSTCWDLLSFLIFHLSIEYNSSPVNMWFFTIKTLIMSYNKYVKETINIGWREVHGSWYVAGLLTSIFFLLHVVIVWCLFSR